MLKEKLQAKILREHSSDGAGDVFGGVILIFLAISLSLGLGAFYALGLCGPLFLIIYFWKRRITYPRLGYAKLKTDFYGTNPFGKNELIRIPIFLVVYWLLASQFHWSEHKEGFSNFAAMEMLVVFATASATSTLLLSQRLGYYRILSVLPLPIAFAANAYEFHPFGLLLIYSLLSLTIGLYRLRTFLLRYPRLEEADGQI